MADAVTVLGLDPSTTDTGMAVLRIDAVRVEVRLLERVRPSAKAKRWDRIRETRRALAARLAELPDALDLVAYEMPFIRGGGATAALYGAVGAYMTLSALAGVPDLALRPQQATAAVGAFLWPHKGVRQREESKAAVIEAVNERLGLTLGPGDDALADAIAVALAGYKAHTGRPIPPAPSPLMQAIRRKAGLLPR